MGSTNEIMSLHLSGSLTQLLKPYQSRSWINHDDILASWWKNKYACDLVH
jgi:hypothetical protein